MKFVPKLFKLFFSCVLTVGLCVCQNNFAQQMINPPQELSIEGVPSLPQILGDDFKSSSRRKSSTFIGWTKDKGILGYSNYYEPFFLTSPLNKRVDIELALQEPDKLALQPSTENNFLYTEDNNGDENAQIFRYDLQTRLSSQLTSLPEIEFVNSYIWSVDGSLIYFVNQKKKANTAEIYEINPLTKEKRRLIILKSDTHFLVDVSSEYLLFSQYISNGHTIYFTLNLKTLQITELTKESAYYKEAKFTNDSRGIWWLSDAASNFFNLYYYDLGQKKITKVNKPEINITDFAFSPSEKLLALKVNDSGADSIHIYEVSENQISRELNQPKIEPGVIEKLEWRDDRELAFGFESLKTPSEIRSYNVTNSVIQTWAQGEVTKNIVDQIQDTRLIKWKSFDNREISGFLIAPKQKDLNKKFPIIIDIHGGPKDQYQPYFNSYRIYSVARLQSAIIFPNIRGSSGFGKEFENLDNKEKREDALKDLQALLDWIKTQPDLDANRVIVKGTSYGAFMALALGIKEQNRLKGVIAEVPPVSIKNYINKSVKSLQDIYAFEYGLTTDEELMAKTESLSLLNKPNLDKWKLPVLLTAGQNDVRVPLEDIEKLKNELKARGVPIWYLKAANEGHFWSEYDNNVYLELSKIAFFTKYTN